MDKKVLGISKHDDKSIASGFDHATRTGDNTFSIFFTDGSKVDLTIPLPANGKDGISISNVNLDENRHVICTMSDGTTIDAGELPNPRSISDAKFNSSGKLVIEYDDGTESAPIAMPSASVEVSQLEGNSIEQKSDGMYVPKTDLTNYVEKEIGKGLSKNDFTDEEKKQVSDNKSAITKLNANDTTVGSVAYQIADALGKLNKLSKKIVDVLPSAEDADANTIYMIKEDGGNYAMFTVVTLADGSKSLASMGSTDIDLTDYLKKDDAKITYLALADVNKDVLALFDTIEEDGILYLSYNGSKLLTQTQLEAVFADYSTYEYVDEKLGEKLDKISIVKKLDATRTDEQIPSAKCTFDELSNKIDKEYGTSHKGEVLVVGEDGFVSAKAFDVIDDEESASTTTYSSEKIDELLTEVNDSLLDKAETLSFFTIDEFKDFIREHHESKVYLFKTPVGAGYLSGFITQGKTNASTAGIMSIKGNDEDGWFADFHIYDGYLNAFVSRYSENDDEITKCNELATMDKVDYSTDEVEIGTYIGEKLYRKCIIVEGTSIGEISLTNIKGLEPNLNIISLTGTLDTLHDGQYTFPVPYTLLDNTDSGLIWYRLYTYYDKTTGGIMFSGKSSVADYYKGKYKLKLIAEYTK